MSQRDEFVSAMVAHVGYAYRVGPSRCSGADGYHDCSGLICYGLVACGAQPSGYCTNSAHLAQAMVDAVTTMSRDEARATKGALAVRAEHNSIIPGVGHVVCSLGDGRTVEAHGRASGVIIGRFDGNREFSTFGHPPGVMGFDAAAGPVVIAAGVNVGWKMAAHPKIAGAYWCVDDAGHVYCYGGAAMFGGQDSWLVAGKVVKQGTAGAKQVKLNGPCAAFTPTPSGNGYWMLTSVGSLYSFGDAKYEGDPHGDPTT